MPGDRVMQNVGWVELMKPSGSVLLGFASLSPTYR